MKSSKNISSSSERPSLEQLIRQWLIEEYSAKETIKLSTDEYSKPSKIPMYLAKKWLRPDYPVETDWISLAWISDIEITDLDILFQKAQSDGVVWTRWTAGHVIWVDSRILKDYSITWHFMDWSVFPGIPESETERMLKEEYIDPSTGTLYKKTGNRWLKEFIAPRRSPIIKMWPEVFLPEEALMMYTDIAFDLDTIFDRKWAYKRVQKNSQNRMTALLSRFMPK